MATILIIASYSNSLTKFRGALIETWLSEGHTIIAAAPGNDVKNALELRGIEYHEIPLERTSLNPFKDSLLLISLIHLLWRIKPEYLFLYTIKPVIYGSLAAFFLNKVAVYSMITGLGYVFINKDKNMVFKRIVVYLYKLALKRNNKVLFQNPDDQSEFVGLNLVNRNKTIIVNGSGVDLNYYSPVPLPGPPLTFLLIARLLVDKGIVEYAEAAKIIKAKYPETNFVLIGSFLPYPNLIKKEQLEEWISGGIIDYRGYVKDVRPHIASADVYVLPSYREGTPRSSLEAMAMGRPVITSDVPGCRETVVDGLNGFLVPVKNIVELADAMKKFIVQPQLTFRMGMESRKIAENKYDVTKVNKVILEAMGL